MAAPLRRQPVHEPIGFSPEAFTSSRRWLYTLILALVVLGAGVGGFVWLSERI